MILWEVQLPNSSAAKYDVNLGSLTKYIHGDLLEIIDIKMKELSRERNFDSRNMNINTSRLRARGGRARNVNK